MKFATPRWWYSRDRRHMATTRALLTPLSWAWSAATAWRIAHATPFDPGVPVVCVGGLTMGGTGKTPVVREIARLLTDRRISAHILSRGYGGSLEGPARVDPARHSAADVGDEPLMLARDLPVWVARDRAAGARAAAAAGAQVIVMDDGHQNPSLKKALSVVVVDAETRDGEWPFGDGRVFPAGPLREPLARGLARAGASILLLPADAARADPELVGMLTARNIVTARLQTPPPPVGRLVGFAGIGKPWKVERALQAAGADLADFAPFHDHFAYDERVLRILAARAAQFDADLITTEKDWVRLPPAWRERVTPWPARAVFEDQAAIEGLLVKFLPPRASPAPGGGGPRSGGGGSRQ